MIPGSEIAELFRKVIRGEASIVPDNWSWDWVWCGNFYCTIDGYKVVIFNDCGELDYVDSATAPDGRTGDFDHWEHDQPVELLTGEESGAMELALETCGGKQTRD